MAGSAYAKIWQIFGKMVFDDDSPYEGGNVNRRVFIDGFEWWALVDDLRTLPPGQIVAGIPHIGELLLL